MNADSFVPPGFSGELRGCGKVFTLDEAIEEGGGEIGTNPPGPAILCFDCA